MKHLIDFSIIYVMVMLLFIRDYSAIRAVSSVGKPERDIPVNEGLSGVPHEELILEKIRKGEFILLCSTMLSTYNPRGRGDSCI